MTASHRASSQARGTLRAKHVRWLVAVAVALACGGATRGPAGPTGVLAPGAEAGARSEGPFRVVFAAPRGAAPERAEISIVFDRALIPLEAADREPPPITITPAVAGTFRWVGARALVFVPASGALPAATEFAVEVPGSLRAADGSTLGAPYRFTFSTPRPKLVQSTPGDGETGVLPTTSVRVELNQAVVPKVFEQHATLTAAGKAVPFTVQRAEPDATKALVIVPRTKLPLDAEIRLTLAATLTGEEGPLPAGTARSIAFRTYGPLAVTGLDCNRESLHGRCAPGSGVGLSFSNPVRFGELKRALRLLPARTLRWPSWYEDDSTTTYVEIPTELAAGQTYTAVVAAGLTDTYGQRLAREYRTEFAMDDYFPRVAIGMTDGTLLPAARAPIPLAAVNAPTARVRAAALSRDDVVRLAQGTIELSGLVRGHARARDFALPSSAAANQIVHQNLDPSLVLGAPGLGVLGLLSEYPADERDYNRPSREKLAKVSDLGIAAKLSRHGSLVWLTRLSTAQPVADAEIELVRPDGQRRRFRTNADGLADIPRADFAPNLDWDSPDRNAVVFASSGSDWNYERAADVAAPWSSNVPVDLSGADVDDGLLFTDRGVYRPGDTVSLKGIVRRRTPEGSAIPSGEKVSLTLKGPSDEVIRRVDARLSAWGTFDTKLRVPATTGLGSHWISATLGRNTMSTRFEVQEYRPAEFRVDVSAEKQSVRGQRIAFDVAASYLFGAPVASAPVRYWVSRQRVGYTPPGAEELVTDASAFYADLPESALSGGSLADAEAELDANGGLRVEQLLTLPGQRSAEQVMLEAEVTDVARATGAGRAAVLVHPADFYVALQPIEGFVEKTPSHLTPKVAVLSHAGKYEAGKRVELELVRRTFTTVTEDTGGGPTTRMKVLDQRVARCEVVSNAAFVSCPLTARAAGYHLIRARGVDARGNGVEAATPVYVLGEAAPFYQGDETRVDLVLDKKLYRVGDRARVLIKSPFPEAEALITVERSGILHRERRTLTGNMPSFEIPVTEQQRPNAFVGVHLVRKLAPGATGSAYRFGYAELRIDPEDKRLGVEVVPNRRELGPGDEVEVGVTVQDASGRGQRAEVTLFAVDEGVLLLTGYEVPDPLPVFTGTRPLQVATLDTRASIARLETRGLDAILLGGKGAEGGGGGEGSARRDFQQTAYFNPNLVTDDSGRARVKFRLPESLTRYRVMAVAVGQGERYGFGNSDVTTSKRLMVRPALPRFFRVGDRVEAGVVVTGKGFGPSEVTVRASATGLELEGARERRIQLPADGSQEVRFAFVATKPGRASLSFQATGGNARDAVAVERTVSAPAVLEATSLFGSTDGSTEERIGSVAGLRRDLGGLEVSLAPTALVGLESSLTALAEYPYGCTEQLSSRLVPSIVRAGLTGAEKPSTATVEAGALVRAILARQQGDGGFGFWDGAERSHPWVSAYALLVLHAAKTQGVDIPARAFTQGIEYLRRYLGALSPEPIELSTAALMLDVLATLGKPDTGYTNRLFEKRAALPSFARALLLSALANGKGDAKQIDALTTELEPSIRVTGQNAVVVENVGDEYAVLMDSPARTHALVLRALVLAKPRHPLIPALARGLLAARRGGTWSTTQESSFALLALDRYRAVLEAAPPDFDARVALGEETLFSARFEGRAFGARSTTIPMSRLQGGTSLLFERDGRGTLFYQARLTYARAELPKTPLDSGLFIQKTLRAIEPRALADLVSLAPGAPLPGTPATSFRAGELVLAELVLVSSAPEEYVAIDDPLPAGFEPIDTTFQTTATRYDIGDSPEGAECPDCADERSAIAEGRASRRTDSRRETHDDRVAFIIDHLSPGVHRFRYLARANTFGRYVVPPARAFGMYAPEVFGRTAAASVEVR